jgi:CubicO group peptidase (beta-lactamase class C family)
MKSLNLENTKKLMAEKEKNQDFDSYAIYVKCGEYENSFFSKKVNEDTYFDLASCGKILVTSPLILKAIDEGKLKLEDKLENFFEDIPLDKKNITIKHLLSHTSGIVRHDYVNSEREALAREILNRPLAFETGKDYRYSCSGMVLLGFILEKIYGVSLETLFEERIKKPLGYNRSKFNIRVGEENSALCCRWQDYNDYPSPWDDENIRVLKTSAGSGGQFFTLADIIKYVKAVMNKDERLYSKALFELTEKKYTPENAKESRGLGWVYVDEKYSQTGKLFPKGSFGHCGHAGQSIFFNREKDLCVIILTNATRFANMKSGFKGYDYNVICKMREDIHNAIYSDLTEQNLM